MAKLKSTGGEHLAVWDGQRWISIKGEKGDPGTSLTVKGTKPTPADLPATSTAGEAWIVAGAMYVFDGTAWNNIGNVTGPKGDPGSAGPKGDAGVAGAAGKDGTSATVRVGAVAEGPVAVTNTGTNAAAVLNFTIPKGDPGIAGPKGDAGATPAISIGTTTTLATGSPATVTQTGTTLAPVLSFGIPTGPKGDAGAAGTPGVAGKDGTNGTAATVTVGTVKTLAAGQPVTVVNSGTTSAAALDISIPQGSQGIQGVAGADGKAATVALGTVTQGTTLGVTNSGTSSAAVFNFTLVKGDAGPAGPAGKDGSGVTITGTQNGGTWPPTVPHAKGDMILIGTPVPTGVPAGTVTGQAMVFDGVAWANVGAIQGPAGPTGPAGPAGPRAVSADANNYSRLGTDSKIFTPTPTIPAAAVANPLTDGTAAPGVSLKYAREDHVHPLPTLTALGAAAATHTHPATAVTGLATVATTGKYSDLTGAPAAFTLPEASATVLGGIKVGTGLSIATGGVLSATAQSPVDATTTVKGVVMLADATAITAGTTGKIPDAGQLKAQVDPKAPSASPTFTGTVQIPAGTAAAPSLVFTGDVDTGVFAPSANSVGLAAGGVSAVEATATGVTLHGTLTAGGLKYPATKGTKDQVLASDGAGNVEWHTVTAGTSYTLPAATALALGGVKVADPAAITLGAAGYVVDAAQLKAAAYTLPDATASKVGGVTLADAAAITAGTAGKVVDAAQLKAAAYSLPTATEAVLGGVKLASAADMAAGTAGKIVDAARAKAAYVDITGDTMTGGLTVPSLTATSLTVSIASDNPNWNASIATKRTRGTIAAPTPNKAGDLLATWSIQSVGVGGGVLSAGGMNVLCAADPVAGDSSIPSKINFLLGAGKSITTAVSLSAGGAAIPKMTEATAWNGAGISVTATAGIGVAVHSVATGAGNYAFYSDAAAPNYFKGNVGVNVFSPTEQFEVMGKSALRGDVNIVGNITSTGTAHNFTAASIPRSAVAGIAEAALDTRYLNLAGGTLTGALTVPGVTINGNISSTGTAHSFVAKSIPVTALSAFPTVPTATPASQTATGVAGQVQYDANYLYLAIGANDWRRVPLMAWDGSGASGSGAGAKDEALPATFVNSGSTGFPVGPVITKMAQGGAAGKIMMVLGNTIPPLATGIKVQYRVHGGDWKDAVVSAFIQNEVSANATWAAATFAALIRSAGWNKAAILSGPPPGVPYITRMAWVSTLGTGLWSQEFTAVTPTA